MSTLEATLTAGPGQPGQSGQPEHRQDVSAMARLKRIASMRETGLIVIIAILINQNEDFEWCIDAPGATDC